MGIALGTKAQQRAALRKAGKAAAAVALCNCQQHGLKALPCPSCGWEPLTETYEAYPLNEAVKQAEVSMAKKSKKKRGKGC
jgi:hypothetical protein